MRSLLSFFFIFSLVAFQSSNSSYKVEFKGALKNIMHKGDVSAKADLADFKEKKHFYALGAAENLKGEIQIFDSESFNTSVIDGKISFDKSYDKKAALLVYCTVDKWQEIEVPEKVSSYEELEEWVAKTAKKHSIDINEPFPFLLQGKPNYFNWHLIDWKEGDKEHSHEKHVNSGLNGKIENTAIEMLGFYSDSHHTIFTHHTTNMHIHFRSLDGKLAGHIDELELSGGMTLKLPLRE